MDPRPSLPFCACKTATLGPHLQVCMGPRPHLRFSALITARLAQEQKDYIGSRPHLWFCACKTAALGLEIHVSVGPRPHLWILHAKQWLLDQNNESLFPTHDLSFCACTRTCLASETLVPMGPSPHLWFLHAKRRVLYRITNFYGSQTSPVILCKLNSMISIGITSLHGSQPLSIVFACKTATLGPDLQVCMGPWSHLRHWALITACLTQEQKGYMGTRSHLSFCAFKSA